MIKKSFYFLCALFISNIALARNPIPANVSIQKWLSSDWEWRREYVGNHVTLISLIKNVNFNEVVTSTYILYLHGCLDGTSKEAEKNSNSRTIADVLVACTQDFQDRFL